MNTCTRYLRIGLRPKLAGMHTSTVHTNTTLLYIFCPSENKVWALGSSTISSWGTIYLYWIFMKVFISYRDIELFCSMKRTVIIEHEAAKFNIPASLYIQHVYILRFPHLLYVINIETRLAGCELGFTSLGFVSLIRGFHLRCKDSHVINVRTFSSSSLCQPLARR